MSFSYSGAVIFGAALLFESAIANAAFVDTVGSEGDSNILTAREKGNVYRVDVPRVLVKVESRLSLSEQDLTFSVYSSPVEFGVYTRVQSATTHVAAGGLDWYSSPTLNVPLSAGTYYLISVSWPNTAQYYFGIGEQQAVSFGAQVHGYATGAHPPGSTASSTLNDLAIYNQQITTVVPECATLSMAAAVWTAIVTFRKLRL